MFFWNGGQSRRTGLVQISLKEEDSINEAAKDWTRSRLAEILLSTLIARIEIVALVFLCEHC